MIILLILIFILQLYLVFLTFPILLYVLKLKKAKELLSNENIFKDFFDNDSIFRF